MVVSKLSPPEQNLWPSSILKANLLRWITIAHIKVGRLVKDRLRPGLGDDGFGQYLAEFTTAVKYGMDITHILLNNSQLGKITKEQRAGEWEVWQTSLHNPNFAEFAKLCGGHDHRLTTVEELDDAIRQALEIHGPALVEIISGPELI